MNKTLHVLPKLQVMHLRQDGALLKTYQISTAANGLGEQKDSYCTPRGWHVVRAKIGHDSPIGSVFVGRRWTNEILSVDLYRKFINRDWILTRILWLSGSDIGKNRLGNVDTMQRYIYIHGSPAERMKIRPNTHGCIGMYDHDILDLFDRVEIGTRILISEMNENE